MDLKSIQKQMELSKQAVGEMNRQNRIFEHLLNETVKGAPEKDKKKIDEIRLKATQAIRLAKEGKADEAQKIILDLQNGN